MSPLSGTALSTIFNFIAQGWIVDSDSLPLSFSFYYFAALNGPALSISLTSASNRASASLPSGSADLSFVLPTLCIVSDISGASTSVNGSVAVHPNTNISVTSYFSSTLDDLAATGDVAALCASINTVSSTINTVDCSQANATFCANKNRLSCSAQPNTCGACLDGFVGISGYSNVRCLKRKTATESSSNGESGVVVDDSGEIGSVCVAHADCIFGNCTNKVCVEPSQTCPGSCSGRGECVFVDPSGNPLQTACLLRNPYCSPTCRCQSGFGGADCSLTEAELADRGSVRAQMCAALLVVADSRQPSAALLDTLVGSLRSTYDPNEVTSEEGTAICGQVLTYCTDLASQGYLSGTSAATTDFLTQTLANFLVSTGSSSSSSQTANQSSASSTVNDALNSLTAGVLLGMVDGQQPVNLVTGNLQISLRKELIDTVVNASLSPPLTSAQSLYGALSPTLQMSSSRGAEAFSTGSGGYTSVILMQFGVNPYPLSSEIKSSLFSVQTDGSQNSPSTASTVRALLQSPDALSPSFSASTIRAGARALQSSSAPDYFITLQFSAEGNFNASRRGSANYTFPACREYDPVREEYVSCGNCNVTSFTNNNVTFGCTTIFSSYSPSAATFGAIFEALLAELSSVLSLNPLTIDLAKSKTVLIVVGSLFLVMVSVGVLLLRWDNFDHHRSMYLLKKKKTAKQKEEIKGIFFGVKGEHGEAVAEYLDRCIHPDLLRTQSLWRCFLAAVWLNHEFLNVFSESSMAVSRFSRWILLCIKFMMGIFFDTLFFAVFFPDNGTCEAFLQENLCLYPVNSATGELLCQWSPDSSLVTGGSCALAPPPSSTVFSLIIIVACVTVSFPLDFLFDIIYGSCAIFRPDLKDLGILNPDIWLGRSTQSEFKESKRMMRASEGEGEGEEGTMSAVGKSEEHWSDVYVLTKTPTEEIDDILDKVKDFYAKKIHVISLPTLDVFEKATVQAIVKYFRILPDHSSVSLPLLQHLWHGSTRSKLAEKLSKIRSSQDELRSQLEDLGEVNCEVKDRALIRNFVLEQFGNFKQYIMRTQYGDIFRDITPGTVNPFLWLLSWMFFFSCLLFFLYYLFNWGVSNGEALLKKWAFIFVFIFIQELTAIQLLRVLVIYILSMYSVRPQLQSINHVVKSAAIAIMQEQRRCNSVDESGSFNVVQVWSPSCRVSRMEVARGLVSSKILQRMTDYDVRNCRASNDISLAAFVVLALSIPILLGVINEVLGDVALGTFISILVDGFLMANDFLLSISIGALIAPYIGIIGFYTMRFYAAPSALRRLNKEILALEQRKLAKRGKIWRASARSRQRVDLVTLLRLSKIFYTNAINYVKKSLFGRSAIVNYKSKDAVTLAWANLNLIYTFHAPADTNIFQERIFCVSSADVLETLSSTRIPLEVRDMAAHLRKAATQTRILNMNQVGDRDPANATFRPNVSLERELIVNTTVVDASPSGNKQKSMDIFTHYYVSHFDLPIHRERKIETFCADLDEDSEGSNTVDYVIFPFPRRKQIVDQALRDKCQGFRMSSSRKI